MIVNNKISSITWVLVFLLLGFPGAAQAAGTDPKYGMTVSYDIHVANSNPFLHELGVGTVRLWNWHDYSDRSSINNYGKDVFQQARDYKALGYKVIVCFHNPSDDTYANVKAYFDWAKDYRGGSGTDLPMKDVIDYWEIVNELNLVEYWDPGGTLSEKANKYVTHILKAAWDSLNPSGEKVIGGSFTAWQGGTWADSIAEAVEAQAYVNAGYLNYCHYAGLHPYTDTANRQQKVIMAHASIYGSKPMIFTEWMVKQQDVPNQTTAKRYMDLLRPWIRDRVEIACFYRFSQSSYWGVVDYSGDTYVKLQPFFDMVKTWRKNEPAGARHEAESLTCTYTGPAPAVVAENRASAGNVVRQDATAVGDSMTFTVPSVPAGTYDIFVGSLYGGSSGIFSTTINGVAIGSNIDSYETYSTFTENHLGQAEVTATGNLNFKFTVAGKNASSSSYKVYIDYVRLVYTSLTLSPLADAYVRGGTYAGTNFGADTALNVKDQEDASYDRRSFLRFDVAAFSAVTNAKLRLKVSGVTATHSVEARYVATDSWGESTITWNNQPSAGAVLDTKALPSVGSWVEFDVTAQVAAEAAGDAIVSFRLASLTADKNGVFHSRETADPPQLVVVGTASSGGSVDLETAADTFVRSGSYADTSYGNDSTMMVKDDSGTDYDRECFIKFDLSSINGPVSSARIRLNVSAMGSDSTYSVETSFVSSDSWTESVTWNTKPASSTVLATTAASGFAANGWVEIDVTSQVNTELTGDKILSVRLRSTSAGSNKYVSFKTYETTTSTDRPVLRIE